MSSSALIKLLRPVAASPDAASGDAALLRRFHDHRDEAAFATLVQRYGRLVWSVCRQMLSHDADAEDAYQATFLALVRSSHDIHGPLAPWLYRVAYRVSLKLRQRLSKQTARDRTTARSEATNPVPDSAWESMLASVHEEIAQLPEKLRMPLVLCCMEGQPVTEAAQTVGWKLGTFSARLTQAKQLLIEKLTRRGLPITAARLSLITLSQASAQSTTHQQLAVQLLHGQSPSPLIRSLSQGVVVMSLRKQLTTAAVILLGVAGAGSWVFASPQQTGGPAGGGGGTAGIVQGPGGGTMPGGMPGTGGFNPIMGAQHSPWEYRFIPTGPKTEQEYSKQFTQMQQQGFEFCGTVSLKSAVPSTGGDAGIGSAGGGDIGGGFGAGGGLGGMGPADAAISTALVFKRAVPMAGGMSGMMGGGNGMGVGLGRGNPPPGLGSDTGGGGLGSPGGAGTGTGIPGGLGGGISGPGGGSLGSGAGAADGVAGAGIGGVGTGGNPSTDQMAYEQAAYKKLAGNWQAKATNSTFRSLKFNGNEVVIDGKPSTCFINRFKTPMEMNIVGNGTLIQCIYQIEDGVLKLAFYGRSENDRPAKFRADGATPGTSPQIEMEFTRIAPSPGGGGKGGAGRP